MIPDSRLIRIRIRLIRNAILKLFGLIQNSEFGIRR
jgi:hypothetical protein